jgi:glycosyltransferase involved in cell wall biosynthesis
MKLAYVSIFDATDIRNWSGTYWHMYKSLESQGVFVELIGNLQHGRSVQRKVRKLWAQNIEHRNFLHFWDSETAKDYSADVDRRLKALDVDAVLCSNTIALAYLRSHLPKILWTDATYSGLSQMYDEFKPDLISAASAKHATRIDRLAEEKCDLLIYASEWAADSAIKAGNITNRTKVKMVPFGANLSVTHTEAEIPLIVSQRSCEEIRLLFVGVEWDRKGADKAISIAADVERSGFKVELTIVGCVPPSDLVVLPPFVRILRPLDKSVTEDLKLLTELFARSHFMVLPTRAEAFGLVFAEASAFGLPSLSHRIGGVTTVVKENMNGFLFDINDPISDWSRQITSIFQDKNRLHELALSSFGEYSSRLNWTVAGREAAALAIEMLSGQNQRRVEVSN